MNKIEKIMRAVAVAAVLGAATLFVSCTPGERGAVIGGATGAAIGGAAADAEGALVGGAVGALAGSAISKNRARRHHYRGHRYRRY